MRNAVSPGALAMARSKQKHRKIILRIDAPCLCGSGKSIQECHLDFDGRLRKKRPRLAPPGPTTGHAHADCYLRGTNDCSHQISREHYISQSVLEQLGRVLRITGAPWLSPGEALETTVGNLTAKILCKRHNEALAPLDTEAGLFFSTLTEAIADLRRKTLSRRPRFHLIGGEALQLWMLKVACGLYFSFGSSGGERISKTHSIDLQKVQRAFFEDRWDQWAGLYFSGNIGTVINLAHQIGFAPLTTDKSKLFAGTKALFNGFGLELVFDTRDTPPGPWSGVIAKPTELTLRENGRSHHIVLTWPPGTPEQSVQLDGRRFATP